MRYLILFAGQLLLYLIIVLNYRAVALGLIPETAVTDFLIGVVNFVIFRKLIGATTYREMVAYAGGGSVGSVLAIYVSRWLGWSA